MGVSKVEQMRDNITALDIRLSGGHLAALDLASTSIQFDAVWPVHAFNPPAGRIRWQHGERVGLAVTR